MTQKKQPTYIDLFAGCGGLSLGLHCAGWKGLFAIEKSQDAFKTLNHNLIQNKHHFDWPLWLPQTNLEIDETIASYHDDLLKLRDQVDLIAGGPPCQGFSTAGRRKENDRRNNLIASYIDFIKIIKPKLLFFENVKGFTLEFKKNKDKGMEYSSFVAGELNKAGYFVHGELVNFGDFGIPQKRTRFILVGIRMDLTNASEQLARSFFTELKSNLASFLSNKELSVDTNLHDAISDLLKLNGIEDSLDSKGFKAGVYSEPISQYQKFLRVDSVNTIPDSHRFSKHKPQITYKFQDILNESIIKNKDISKTLRERYCIKKHTVIPLDKDQKCPTITTLPDDYIHYYEPRILTVREYARIQSFPDWYEFKGKYTTGGKQRTQEVPRYSQIGNAIPPLFGEQCGLVLKHFLS
jgi:DNA (cytosine-5)-methyltransferase 1